MQSDLPQQTRDQTLLALARKHLKRDFESLDELDCLNISGMSNVTYAISPKLYPTEKIVIRFFESKAADFKTEASIFKLMGERGWGPKEIEHTEQYRVEEYIDGRPLTTLELRNPFVAKKAMELICETNYDPTLNSLIRDLKEPSQNFSTDLIYDREKGWFNRYMNEVRPVLQNTDFTGFPRAHEIFQLYEEIVRDKDAFIQEYESLFPVQQEIVFTHNDIQENNIMAWNKNKTQFVLIDFEYSSLNFRGYDIASYLNEVSLDYTHPVHPKFRYYLEYFDQLWEEGEVNKYLTYYAKKLFQIKCKNEVDFQYKDKQQEFLDQEVPILRDQVLKCMLMSDLQWAFWSMIMMPIDDLMKCQEFYMEYGLTRLEMYVKHKEMFLGRPSKIVKNLPPSHVHD
eukprot:403374177